MTGKAALAESLSIARSLSTNTRCEVTASQAQAIVFDIQIAARQSFFGNRKHVRCNATLAIPVRDAPVLLPTQRRQDSRERLSLSQEKQIDIVGAPMERNMYGHSRRTDEHKALRWQLLPELCKHSNGFAWKGQHHA